MDKSKINNTYYVILGVLAISFLIFFIFTISYIFKKQITINISGDGSDKGIFIDFVTIIIAIASSVLVYLGFRQQVKQMKIASADKKFERYLLLIEDVEKLENKIAIRIINPFIKDSNVSSRGGEAIDDYIEWLEVQPYYQATIENYINFGKDLYVYLFNAATILYYIGTLKNESEEHYQILYAKFFLNNSRLYSQVTEMLKYKNIIAKNNLNYVGIIDQLQRIKNGIEIESKRNRKSTDGKNKRKKSPYKL